MKKKIYLILILILSLVVIPVGAKSKDNFVANDSVKLSKSIASTTFVAGNDVDVNSEIDGAAFVAGNNVSISGMQDILFAAGRNVTVNEASTKDAFLAGASINVESVSVRDLYAAGENIRIDSNIGRNAYLGGSKITINGTIDGDVEIAAENITIGKEAVITGTLNYPETANINIPETAKIGKKTTYEVTEVTKEDSIMYTIEGKFYSFLSMLLIGIILMALNKKVFAKIAKKDKELGEFAKDVGIGFVCLLVIPIAAIIIMCTVIGLPLALISLILYGLMIYLSVIPTAYYLGHAFLKGKVKNDFLLFTIALFAIYILKMIPGIGGLVGFISLCFGLGVYVDLIRSNIKTK